MRSGLVFGVLVWGLGAGVFALNQPDEPAPVRDEHPAASHWSLIPPQRPDPPEVARMDWVVNPIDRFILLGLERENLDPAPEATRAVLARRLWFDLLGLPPDPEEVDRFVADSRPDAYERMVDRLLASPQYGERSAVPWLDLARFSESDGFKSDLTRPNAWRYRDWVIDALNQDLPYDQFVSWQLAGDELQPHSREAFVATGFNRNWPLEDNNKVPGLNRQLILDDMTDTTASVFLGLTVACARCHDHKYDPISQRDYYRFQAIFAATEPDDQHALVDEFAVAVDDFVREAHRERAEAARRSLAEIERPYREKLLRDRIEKLPADVRKALETPSEARSVFQEDLLAKHAGAMNVDAKAFRSAMSAPDLKEWETRGQRMAAIASAAPSALPVASGMKDSGPNAPDVRLLFKGTFGQPREVTSAGIPAVFTRDEQDLELTPISTDRSTGRRAALARWLTQPDHPLTARVIVNRLWQTHFGRGIVATPSDFGTQGAPPSHPQLLDWLATELVRNSWSIKSIKRLIVTSAAYRQSSDAPRETLAADPDNYLWSRMPRRRLEGEAVRDTLLAVSGELATRMRGPSVFPELPPGVTTRGGWSTTKEPAEQHRRSIYVFHRRNLKFPLFEVFDAPDPNVSCPERNTSVHAPQALFLLNSANVARSAREFARRVRELSGPSATAKALVERAYRLALGRPPDEFEQERAAAFLTSAAKDTEALDELCHAILNLNEFIFID